MVECTRGWTSKLWVDEMANRRVVVDEWCDVTRSWVVKKVENQTGNFERYLLLDGKTVKFCENVGRSGRCVWFASYNNRGQCVLNSLSQAGSLLKRSGLKNLSLVNVQPKITIFTYYVGPSASVVRHPSQSEWRKYLKNDLTQNNQILHWHHTPTYSTAILDMTLLAASGRKLSWKTSKMPPLTALRTV